MPHQYLETESDFVEAKTNEQGGISAWEAEVWSRANDRECQREKSRSRTAERTYPGEGLANGTEKGKCLGGWSQAEWLPAAGG